jgi:putative phosphoesterase
VPASARLALLGDVHANHAALCAVLAQVDAAGITEGACTGDLVMRGETPAECIDEIHRRGWPCVRGNTDQKVAARSRRPADHPKARRRGSRSWTSAVLDDGRITWLGALPTVAHLEVAGVRVALMHGSPNDPRNAVDEATPDDELAAVARELDAQVVVMGHLHRQIVRRADGCLFVNPGSVGEAVSAEDRRPRWAWLDVADGQPRVHMEIVELPLATVRRPAT